MQDFKEKIRAAIAILDEIDKDSAEAWEINSIGEAICILEEIIGEPESE